MIARFPGMYAIDAVVFPNLFLRDALYPVLPVVLPIAIIPVVD
jgi:hypothetical protein